MNGTTWPDYGEAWPESWASDIGEGIRMPRTLAEKLLDRGGGRAEKVVPHTQPPPVAQNAREVQGQLSGLLRTVKALEEKLDDMTQRLAVFQRASAGSQE